PSLHPRDWAARGRAARRAMPESESLFPAGSFSPRYVEIPTRDAQRQQDRQPVWRARHALLQRADQRVAERRALPALPIDDPPVHAADILEQPDGENASGE